MKTLTNEQIDGAVKTFTHMLSMDLEGKYLTKYELEYAITALEMAKANVWQPIETAPKDGTEIFVLLTSGCAQRVKYFFDELDAWSGWVDFQDPTCDYVEKWFVGWIPTPPKESE